MSELDIIIPAKNEEGNIEKLAAELVTTLNNAGIDYNLIFVDDNSTDKTSEKVKKVIEKYSSLDRERDEKRIKLVIKVGLSGKATSILQGVRAGNAPFIAMIDADLQYPPSAIPAMFDLAKKHGIVVANRKKQKVGLLRRIGTKIDYLIFEKLLLGLTCDSQSGLKVFKREIIDNLDTKKLTPWTLDVPLILTATDMGYKVQNFNVEFTERKSGKSKINFLKVGAEIAVSNLKLAFRPKKIYQIKSETKNNATGAGIAHKGKRFITHTRLHHRVTALKTLVPWQRNFFFALIAISSAGIFLAPKASLILIVSILSFLYFVDLAFSAFIINRTLTRSREIKITKKELANLNSKNLPIYSILCPLYKEANVLPAFIDAIYALDWPKDKLDVLLLLEEDDTETIQKAKDLDLPKWIRTIIVPHSLPKTKPKACNFGLNMAQGEYLVIYDAEDRPERSQLKKAFIAFGKAPRKVVCLQGKLNYYNSDQNLLTRLFTAEYSLWFDLILPGLQTLNTTIPLGGTSNHFRTNALKFLDGWDPFNVTEDADLGTRLFKQSFQTAVFDSTTLEEANSKLLGWIKQRSRWIKGYLQTYLVHMRNPISFYKRYGRHVLIFQLITGLRMVFTLVNPILWLTTISYFAFRAQVGTFIEELYPAYLFYLATFTMVTGNFFYFYIYMIALAKRGKWDHIKYSFFIPFYWLMGSIAASLSFYQLIVKPHYWEKTAHGLHIKPTKTPALAYNKQPVAKPISSVSFSPAILGSIALVGATVFGFFANFLFNAYLGRIMDVSEFGNISLINNIYAIGSVATTALAITISYKSAFTLGKYGVLNKKFWQESRRKVYNYALLATILWLIGSPSLAVFFNSSQESFLLFSPFWIIALVGAVDAGFLKGALKFGVIAVISVIGPVTKLALAYLFVNTGYTNGIYLSIPLSTILPFLLGWIVISRIQYKKKFLRNSLENAFPVKYFGTSVLYKLSSVFYLNLDVILAKHYLNPQEAGEYALLSLSAKIIYFLGTLFSQFISPLIAKAEGARENSQKTFANLFMLSLVVSGLGFVVIGKYGNYSVPLVFGEKALPIVELLPTYAFGIFCFTLATTIINYHQAKARHAFSLLAFAISIAHVIYIGFYHNTKAEIADITGLIGIFNLFYVVVFHIAYEHFASLATSINTGLNLLLKPASKTNTGSIKVLIYNWRDIRHKWAGGAEVYIHELAKRMVERGYEVTLFCANDGKNPSKEKIDGVKIERYGNFISVYFWAFVFYVFKYRKNTDIIIDSENGIPFFTPLYANSPIIGLIHHVHKDILLKDLKLAFYLKPLAFLAKQLEGFLMPHVYSGVQTISVSPSTQSAMQKLGFGKHSRIEIVTPGIDPETIKEYAKSPNPSILYLGRLQPYKSVDVIIESLAQIATIYPSVELSIAGFGPSRSSLEKLVKKLGLANNVRFLGKVSESEKFELMGKSWIFAYPSSMEGFGISVVEAQATGTPVVASKVPGLKDSVKNKVTGFLVEYGNVDKFANKISLLIKNAYLRQRMGNNAQYWASNFTWDKSVDKLVYIIDFEVARRKSPAFLPRILLNSAEAQ